MGSYIEPDKVFTLNTGASIPAFGLGARASSVVWYRLVLILSRHVAVGARRDDSSSQACHLSWLSTYRYSLLLW